jgi:hypothetical protein
MSRLMRRTELNMNEIVDPETPPFVRGISLTLFDESLFFKKRQDVVLEF